MGNNLRSARSGANLRTLTVVASVCIGAASHASAQVAEQVILNFDGTNGSGPEAPLLADNTGPSGALRGLYGTTLVGPTGTGNVFRLTPPKAEKGPWKDGELWAFEFSGSNPVEPGFGALFAPTKRIGPNTPLYGTTEFGGNLSHDCLNDYYGCGVIYSLTGKSLTTLYAFTDGSDGGSPAEGVVTDKSGALYTTTGGGGGPSGCGTAVKLAPPAQGQTAWTETTLWTFSGGNDGCYPNGLIIDESGTLYGVAIEGGASNNGTVFRLTPPSQGQTAWTEQTLWTFQGGSDGVNPFAPLTFGKAGVVYGTTVSGGSDGDGIVFALSPPKKGQSAWKETIVWSFTGGSDGAEPFASVIIDKTGALYSTAYAGAIGTCEGFAGPGCGTVIKLTPPGPGQTAWTATTLWSFSGGIDGGQPQAALTADNSGVLYGTGYGGGSANDGVVFSLTGTGFVP